MVAAVAIVDGLVEANRMPAAFRTKEFALENCDLAFVRKIDGLGLERSGLDVMGAFRP